MKIFEKLLTPAQASALLSVSPITLRYWANEGRLPFVTTPGGHRRFEHAEVEKLLSPQANKVNLQRIVIVEDDSLHADLLMEYMSVLYPSIEVHIASSGFEAGTMIQALNPQLIFLDLVMPDVDGFAVCAQLRQNETTKNTPIIVISGLSEPSSIERILAAGANQFLAKPIRLNVLKETIELYLQR